MKKKRVAILYIATGRYIVFWKEFYESCERYLLIGHEKVYFVFTDQEEFEYQHNFNVRKIHQEKLGWPYDTLMRFEIFLKAEEELRSFDYIYFMNANLLVIDSVGEEIFPNDMQQFMVTLHPGSYGKSRQQFTYDENPNSSACIPKDQGEHYFMGGFNGGLSGCFLKLCRDLDDAIKRDLKNDVIALVHDESHLNKYMLDKKPLILMPGYGYPEGVRWGNICSFKRSAKIIIRDKSLPKYGGHDWLRGIGERRIASTNGLRYFVIRVFSRLKRKILDLWRFVS